mgnify:CR=1 FL=1
MEKLFNPTEHPEVKNPHLCNVIRLKSGEVYCRDRYGNLVDVTARFNREQELIHKAWEDEFSD